jgi:hypothetical protein
MRKTIFVAAVVIWVLAFVSPAFSMVLRPPAKKTSAAKITREALKISGRVTGYNWTKSTITVLTSYKNTFIISIDKKTVITKAKKTLKMNDIKNGDYVTVLYEVKKAVNIAKSIIIEDRSLSVPTKSRR